MSESPADRPARRRLVDDATARLAAAGIESPGPDARLLLAHVLGVELSRLPLVDDVPPPLAREYDALVARRARREPLQHLTGTAWFRHVELAVGPGVFVPRPETELLAGWAIEQASALDAPVVVDLGTGSGAIARAVADEVPHARVHAVELDPAAHAWAARNLAGTGVDLRQGDLGEAFDDLAGSVDVVVSNPPYIPHEAWESVAAEVRDHDPDLALYATGDGLDVIRVVERRAALLLRAGGVVGIEHADVQGETAPAVLTGSGRWEQVRDHRDLAGRARFVTARAVPCGPPGS
ncbi:peptide chain release factor N(5)-glutamine methyltransferase [Nocardioides cynanchi]|uniref:peptide chain release factor N(5)-glutamine methyltransferase n=1 Tax=Nocardioides cynanchi TaxID=2558918 RepID=UPI0012468B3A|nr:peptide chain release factor N(5)-glutamine methyltransferase [Nocardioides cynanchi]